MMTAQELDSIQHAAYKAALEVQILSLTARRNTTIQFSMNTSMMVETRVVDAQIAALKAELAEC